MKHFEITKFNERQHQATILKEVAPHLGEEFGANESKNGPLDVKIRAKMLAEV